VALNRNFFLFSFFWTTSHPWLVGTIVAVLLSESFRGLRKFSGGPMAIQKRGFARAKPVLSEVEGTPRMPSEKQGLSARANARDLTKISPFGRNDNRFFFAAPSMSLRTCFAPLRESLQFGCGSAALCARSE